MTDRRLIGAKLADVDVASLGKPHTYEDGWRDAIEAAAKACAKQSQCAICPMRAEAIRKLRP